MKVVINKCFGGFSLSPKATLRLFELGAPIEAIPVDDYWPPEKREEEAKKYRTMGFAAGLEGWRAFLRSGSDMHGMFMTVFSPDESLVLNAREIPRNDPSLIRVVEEMGYMADGACASLAIVEIPDGVDYEIAEYDGMEHIAEKHRTWG